MKYRFVVVAVTLLSLTALGSTQDRDQPSAKAQNG